jgi:hypothetical protein
MKFLLHTDLGHDPDDALTIRYLLEHGYVPSIVGLFPGYSSQVSILNALYHDYFPLSIPDEIYVSNITTAEKEKNYNPGKHKMFLNNHRYARVQINKPVVVDKALIIGPAKNLGDNLECEEMYFQGGYSPNSVEPLEKFKGINEIQSFNPSGAREDFKKLLKSDKIKRKYYIGKNVCHGFTKANLKQLWEPKNGTQIRKFWDSLEDSKAMHDVLAAIIFCNKEIGVWEQAKPVFNGLKMSTISTTEEIYTLIGTKL